MRAALQLRAWHSAGTCAGLQWRKASNVGADGDGRSLVLPLALFAGTGAAAGYVLYLEHLDESKVRGPALFPEEVSSPDNPRVWFDVSVNHRQVGRVECELFKQICPKTVENFRCLCTGEKGIGKLGRPLHYKECPIHRIMPGLICQGGDFVNGNGSGGESIYGTAFADEFERGVVLHSKPMLLSMANTGPDTNGSQFFITNAKMHHLDEKHVVFGQVVDGEDVISCLHRFGKPDGSTIATVLITNCGEVPEAKTSRS